MKQIYLLLSYVTTFSTSGHQLEAVKKIKNWLDAVSNVILPPFRRQHFQQFSPSDVFIGYHEDAPASIFLRNCNIANDDDIVERAKQVFLQCATPDAISRCFELKLISLHYRKFGHFPLEPVK